MTNLWIFNCCLFKAKTWK